MNAPRHAFRSNPALPSFTPVRSNFIQRKCACGGAPGPTGECEECRKKRQLSVQKKMVVNQPGDVFEQEADRVADRVTGAVDAPLKPQTVTPVRSLSSSHSAPPIVHEVLESSGHPLDGETRAFMEPRFGYDFSRVRVHADARAGESARVVNALGYTAGEHIVFSSGQYAPATSSGRRLLAHELAHVVQQATNGPRGESGVIQRKRVDIVPEDSSEDETNFPIKVRRAAKSCPLKCCGENLGTVHAMPLFFHNRSRILKAGDPNAIGIGANLHLFASKPGPDVIKPCRCDDLRMIQVVESSPAAGERGESFVDNDPPHTITPFFGDTGMSGRGEHEIPGGQPDAGDKVTTTESIYDRPSIMPDALGTKSIRWRAETCVACIKKNGPDLILGGVGWGFDRKFNPKTKTFGPVTSFGPFCLPQPTSHFLNTLSKDPTTKATGYDFVSAVDCGKGDFPTGKPGNNRVA